MGKNPNFDKVPYAQFTVSALRCVDGRQGEVGERLFWPLALGMAGPQPSDGHVPGGRPCPLLPQLGWVGKPPRESLAGSTPGPARVTEGWEGSAATGPGCHHPDFPKVASAGMGGEPRGPRGGRRCCSSSWELRSQSSASGWAIRGLLDLVLQAGVRPGQGALGSGKPPPWICNHQPGRTSLSTPRPAASPAR